MKKIIFLPLIALVLCGCTKTKYTEPVLNNISFTASIVLNNSEFIADATLLEDELELVVNSPQEIKGLILSISKNGVNAVFNGITFAPDVNSLPNGAVIQILFEIIRDIEGKNAVCNNENCMIQGKVNNYAYDFIFSPAGLPISLEIKDLNLKINFTNVTIQ